MNAGALAARAYLGRVANSDSHVTLRGMHRYKQPVRARQTSSREAVAASKSDNKWLLGITALSVLVTPVAVAIITSNSNRSSTDKDYVNIAVSILNSKDSRPENRDWALEVLNKLSPVPFSRKNGEGLAKGNELYAGPTTTQVVKVPVQGPPMVLVKKGAPLVSPCNTIKTPRKSLDPGEMEELANVLNRSLIECAAKQQYAVTVIDILQSTGDSSSTRLATEPLPRHSNKVKPSK